MPRDARKNEDFDVVRGVSTDEPTLPRWWFPARLRSITLGKGVPDLMSRPVYQLRSLKPDRVCLIKPSALGDIVNTLPVLSSLRQLWPQATIGWVVNRSLRGLLDGHPDL